MSGVSEYEKAVHWLDRAEDAIAAGIQRPDEIVAQALIGLGHATLAVALFCQTNPAMEHVVDRVGRRLDRKEK